jgi:uncharacterized membrane protein YgcG
MDPCEVEVPTPEDRDVLLFCLRMCADTEVSSAIVPMLWTHFESLTIWATSCDPEVLSAPSTFYQKKLVLVTAMADDANAVLHRGIPHIVCETEKEARTVARVAAAARWLTRYCENTSFLATQPPRTAGPATSSGSGRDTLSGPQDVRARYSELAAATGYYLAQPERYTYSPEAKRNALNPEHLDGFKAAIFKVEAEVSRLQGIRNVLESNSGDADGAANHAGREVAHTSNLFDPPLSHFIAMRDLCHWAYAVAFEDFHARLLHNQQVVYSGLRQRLGQVKRALPSMRHVFNDEQRKEVFEALDQVHYDARQFLGHLEVEGAKAASRSFTGRSLRGAFNGGGEPSASGGGRNSGGSCGGGDGPHEGSGANTVGQPRQRSLVDVLFCRPEVPDSSSSISPAASFSPPTPPTATASEREALEAKTFQLAHLTRQIVAETTALRMQMDKAYPDEYASGLAVRAQRAASKMLHWAQSATVIFGPPMQAKARTDPALAA